MAILIFQTFYSQCRQRVLQKCIANVSVVTFCITSAGLKLWRPFIIVSHLTLLFFFYPLLCLRNKTFKIQLWSLWSAACSPSGVQGGTQQPSNDLVNLSLNIWHLWATILIISVRINWSNFVHFIWLQKIPRSWSHFQFYRVHDL